jgi:hypothetical protein
VPNIPVIKDAAVKATATNTLGGKLESGLRSAFGKPPGM